jgi:hypothetical protein
MRALAARFLLVLAPPLGACSSVTAVDVDEREAIPRVAELDFASVQPAEPWDYWELRWAMDTRADSIVGSGGPVARDQIPPEILAELEGLIPATGFGPGCLPGHCFKFLAAVSGTAVEVRASAQGLREFLGGVGSLVEAALLVDAHGFHWDEGEHTGWRAAPEGWELVVFQTVSFCAPVQTDRVRVAVDGEGHLRERAREVWRRLECACV